MSTNREVFLEKQINLYHDLIDEMENSKINRKQKADLENLKSLYKQYIGEYKEMLIAQQAG